MMHRQRGMGGRTRVTPRPMRRAPSAVATEEHRLATARRVAADFVAARWPELAGVTPVITARYAHPPRTALLERLELDALALAGRHTGAGEYVFTFAGERSNGEGAATPVVANVTVDTHYRIVKTSVSR